MYIPGYFSESDPDVLIQLINDYSFGLLVTTIDGRPYASHLPFLACKNRDDLVLYGHLAKANPHWRSLENTESLAIFQPGGCRPGTTQHCTFMQRSRLWRMPKK